MASEQESDMPNPLDLQREQIWRNNERLHSLGIRSLVDEVNTFSKRVPLPTTRKKRTYQETIPQSSRVLRSHSSMRDGEDSEEMADDQVVEDEGAGQEGEEKQKGGRKRTKMHHVYDRLNVPPQRVHYNAKGQPNGNNASEFSNFIATLVKSHIPLAHDDWRQVDISWKLEFMQTLRKFYVVDDELKEWVWGTTHKKWRDFKSDLKEKHFEEEKTDEELLTCRDDRVTIEDWEWLVTRWRSEDFK